MAPFKSEPSSRWNSSLESDERDDYDDRFQDDIEYIERYGAAYRLDGADNPPEKETEEDRDRRLFPFDSHGHAGVRSYSSSHAQQQQQQQQQPIPNAQPATPSASQSSHDDDDFETAGGFRKIPHPLSSFYTHKPDNRPSSASQPSLNMLSSPIPERAKKRTFQSHLDGDDYARTTSPNKSHRASPAPAPALARAGRNHTATRPGWADDDFAAGLFSDEDFGDAVDLTGDPETVNAQIEEQHRMLAHYQQLKRDEEMARQLQADVDLPRAPTTANAAASNSGPTAFDRILPRTNSSFNARLPISSLLAPDSPTSPTAPPLPTPSAIAPVVPGSWPVNDDDDDDDDGFEITGSRSLSRPAGQAVKTDVKNEPGISSAEVARRAALDRYRSPSDAAAAANNVRAALDTTQATANNPYSSVYGANGSMTSDRFASYAGYNGYAGYQGFQSTAAAGPSTFSSFGQSVYGQNPYSTNGVAGNAYNPPGPGLNGRGGFLGNLVDLTSHYDYTNMTDGSGNPLDLRLQSYISDIRDDPRKTDAEIKELLANIRPDMDIPKEDRGGTPDQLRYPLYEHQKLALRWMTSSEEGGNRGGILADDMGLGKTISTLSLMLTRQPTERLVKTNLIVGPVALIQQWVNEIKEKTRSEHRLSVLLYHGVKSHYDEMKKYDVVLTSYGKVAAEQRRYDIWCAQNDGSDPALDRTLALSCPLIHPRSHWYRVILDEAQCIKNPKTRNAKGAFILNAQYRWCLTGTPMMNGVHELQSLMQFLQIRPYNNPKEFSRAFGSLSPSKNRVSDYARDKAMSALRVVLKAIMLRRMKTSEIDGKPLVELPLKTIEVCHSVFSPEEAEYYKDLETQTATKFNKFLRAGTVGKNYSNVLVLLLRLRQVCCHPHLNLDVGYVGHNELNTEEMADLAAMLPPETVARLKQDDAQPPTTCPICLDVAEDPIILIPCGHQICADCLQIMMERAAQDGIRNGDEQGGATCSECRGDVNYKKIITFSSFKSKHMPDPAEKVKPEDEETASEASDSSSDDDVSESEADDGKDANKNGDLKGFVVPDDEEDTASEAEDDEAISAKAVTAKINNKKPKKHRKGRKKDKGKEKEKEEKVRPHMLKELRIKARKNQEDRRRYMRYLKKNWQDSAKVTKCCEILTDIANNTDGEKTIVFSQFTFLLDLLEIPIKNKLGIKYCRYDGGMSRTHRDVSLADFKNPASQTKVMLVSLKAGNAGLNLTVANHCIIMDPFWNPYIEMQAIDRAHRIGQQRPVMVHRLLIEGTVEDRIMDLQEKKRSLVDSALDEGASKQIARLSTRELAYLFGVSADGNGGNNSGGR